MPKLDNLFNKNSLIAVTAVLSIINGIAYLFFTNFSFAILGISADGFDSMITQYYGACAIGYGTLLWLIKDAKSPHTLRAALASILITLGPSAAVGISGIMDGVFNKIGWLFIFTDMALSIFSFYLLLFDFFNRKKG
jgi:hypothetical protein